MCCYIRIRDPYIATHTAIFGLRQYNESTPTPNPMARNSDLLVPAIREFVNSMLLELPKSGNFETHLTMAATDPVIGSALHFLAIAATQEIGEYHHPDEVVQAGVRSQFEVMSGSLALSFEELVASAYGLGWGVSQWGVEPGPDGVQLIDIQIINPKDYTFRGRNGAIQDILYRSGSYEVAVPYSGPDGRLCHVVNARHLAFRSPRGAASLDRCLAAWKAWKIIMGEMMVAAQRAATPIIIGYSDSDVLVPLLDNAGRPVLDESDRPIRVQAPKALLDQLETLENRSVLSTDARNRIESLHQESSGMFFFEALRLLDRYKLEALLVPATIFEAHGAGDSNLNSGQRVTLDLVIRSLVDQVKEVLLNGPIRFVVEQNYGPQENWGKFVVPEEAESLSDRATLLTAIQGAVTGGLIPASDAAISDRAYQLIGVDPPKNKGSKMGYELLTGRY
jgi:hypothetical protein